MNRIGDIGLCGHERRSARFLVHWQTAEIISRMGANGPIILASLSPFSRAHVSRDFANPGTRVSRDESSRFHETLRQCNRAQERSLRSKDAGKPALNRGAQTGAPRPRY